MGCTSTTEPEPITTPDQQAAMARADSMMTAMDPKIKFMTAPGAGSPSDPACQSAIRKYALLVTAYIYALNNLRAEPSKTNAFLAAMAAAFMIDAGMDMTYACEARYLRPA